MYVYIYIEREIYVHLVFPSLVNLLGALPPDLNITIKRKPITYNMHIQLTITITHTGKNTIHVININIHNEQHKTEDVEPQRYGVMDR